jgi:hypothetical protein
MNISRRTIFALLSFIPVIGTFIILIWFSHKELKGEINRKKARLFLIGCVIAGILLALGMVGLLSLIQISVDLGDVIDKFMWLFLLCGFSAGVNSVALITVGMFWDWFEIH